ncbi:MAG TPA: DUF4190 domain-containing protein [Solirubrobacteraceae bacterium]|jgi:hypothetical protein|nr:DUF4190 domain-containing protein [Solirubrobacteraceae bacterium]
MATAALVLAILGLAAFLLGFLGLLFFVNLPLSLLALILGAVGRGRVDRGQRREGREVASAGMALGIVGVAVGLIGLAVWIAILVGLGQLVSDSAPPPDTQLALLRALPMSLR